MPNLNRLKSIKKATQAPIQIASSNTNGQSRYSQAFRFLQELAGTFANDCEDDYNDKLQLLLVIKEFWCSSLIH